MSEIDFDRTARLWIQDGPSQLADRVLDAALDEIHVTRQGRVWGPARRSSSTNTAMKVAIAGAAVVVVAIAGFNLLPGGGPGGPIATPIPTPTPTPSPASFDSHAFGELEPGTYVLESVQPVRITFTVPAGWEKLSAPATIWAAPGNDARLGFMTVDNVFVDPCQPDLRLLDPPVGPTVDDLATALGSVAGLEASAPTDITLAGFAGKRVDLTVLGRLVPCAGADMVLLRGTVDVPAPELGDDYRMWIVDVDGKRLVMVQVARTAATATERAELQAIVDSIEIESATPAPSPSP